MRIKLLLLLLILQLTLSAQKDSLYNDLRMALQEPEKVLTLDLSGAGLTEVPEDILKFPNMEGLFLQNNDLVFLPAFLREAKKLKRLVADNNPLLDVQVSLKNISGLPLHFLSLRQCNIDFIPADIVFFDQLVYLDLSGNYISWLPDHIGELTKLVELNLAGNRLVSVSPRLWNCSRLKRIDLSAQDITGMDTVLAVLGTLQNLHEVKINYMPSKFYDQVSCAKMIIINARINESFPVHKLRVGYLSLLQSEIQSADKFFASLSGNTTIKTLKLDNCATNKGLNGISRCRNLETLELSNCALKGIHEIHQLKQLRVLRIENGTFTEQEISAIKTALLNTSVYASGQPVYPFKAGPVTNVQVPVQSYVLDAQLPHLIQTPNVVITIPANSFSDTEGNIAKGNVQLNYREFFDPVAIALSGINMITDSTRGEFMSSAGMFEINATQGGKPLEFATNSKVTAQVLSSKSGKEYSFFSTNNTEWKTVQKNIDFDSLGPVERARQQRIDANRPVFNMLRPKYTIQKTCISTSRDRNFFIQISSARNYDRTNEKSENFIGDPGLEVLKKYTFRYNGECYKEDKKELDSISRLVQGAQNNVLVNKFLPADFEYIDIVPDRKNDCYQLTVKFRGSEYTYPVILEEGRKSNTAIQKANEKFFTSWKNARKKSDREAKIARYIKEEIKYREAYAAYRKKLDSLGFGSTAFFVPSPDPELEATYLSKFNLTKMRKYNIDKIMSNPNSIMVKADYEADGEKVEPELVILVDISLNTAFTFGNGQPIVLNPGSRCSLIAVLDDNTIGICRNPGRSSDKEKMVLDKINTKGKKLDEIRKML